MSYRKLPEWETKLRSQVEEVDLLGEIALTPEEVIELGNLIGDLVRSLGWEQAKEALREKYPCSFAIYLVSQGIHGYEEGDFWSGVRETTGLNLSPIQTIQWGQLFESIVADLGVARFSSLGGYRYVGPILAHGGIPDYCLLDFFEHFIKPLVTRPQYAVLSTSDFIEERLYQSSTQYVVDKPVIRFLQYGGKVAEDFVERCRQMATRAAETGIVPSAEEVGLPPQVVERYREWLEGRVQPSLRKRGKYRKPVLLLDPWGWGPSLYLPSQQIPASESEVRVIWRVYAGSELVQEVPIEVRREEIDLKTAAESIPLPVPASEYRAELVFERVRENGQGVEREVQRVWQYPGPAEDRPLMVFNPDTRELILPRRVLPARRLWILLPLGTELETEPLGALRVTEELPRRLPWEWREFIGKEIDLAEARQLIVRKGGSTVSEFIIESAEPQDQPFLEGENLFPIEDGHPPLYIGTPPMVCTPLPVHRTRLHKWRVAVRSEGGASPDINLSGTLEDLEEDVSYGDGFVTLRLNKYLGSSPMGNYKVTIRGPLGYRANLAFRILPALEIVGHDTLYLPDESQPEVQFLLETSSQLEVLPQPGARDCRVTQVKQDDAKSLYEVTVGQNRSKAPLRFVLRKPDGETVFVAISVPIRRLRWMIVLSPEQALALEWRIGPLRLPLEALEQSRDPYLFVDLFGGVCDKLEATLRLEDDEGLILQEQSVRFKKGQPDGRFDLRGFLDTMRHASSPLLSLKLGLRGLPDTPEEVAFPVLFVTRRFVVEKAEVDTVWEGGKVHLLLRWQSPVRLRHRFVRFWSVWQPWKGPLEVTIPDEARGEHRFSVAAEDLAPGKYLLEFGTRDPWAASQPPVKRPPLDDQTVIPVLIPPDAVQRRLKELADLKSQGKLPFAAVMERACIRQDLGQEEMARADFQWCFENLDAAEISQILALIHCVSFDPISVKAIRLKMAAAPRLARVLDAYRAGQLDENSYREYLRLLPRHPLLLANTCELLLTVDDEKLRLYAVQQLLRRGCSSGAQAVVEWVKEGILSDEDAMDLLESKLSLAIEVLKQALPHPVAVRLLEKLGKKHPDQVPVIIVRPGYWVRCIAGWGRIERIEGPEGEEVAQFLYTERTYRLHVLLHAQDPKVAEPVLLDLDKGMVTFLKADRVYTCTKCGRFSTQYIDLILDKHNRFAHGGMSPAFRPEPGVTLEAHTAPEFAFVPPANPWS